MSMKRVLGVIGLIVLVAVIVGLVAVAVDRHSDGTSPQAAPTGTAKGLPGPNTPVDADTLHAVTTTPLPYFSVANKKYALLATGGCRATPLLDAVGKNGKKLFALRTPAKRIVRVVATSATHAFVIGGNGKCRLTRYNTVNSGITWTKAPQIGGVWTPTSHGVRGPTGAVGHPCSTAAPEPLGLAPGGRHHAIVICRVGVYETTTGPHGWRPTGQLPTGKPAAVTLLPDGHGAMLMADEGYCLGLRLMTTTDTGKTWTAGKCFARSHTPSAISISPNGSGLILAAGHEYATANSGKSWTKFTPTK
jgi:photosystem II stability/assembly factor-like uncharacterized protein